MPYSSPSRLASQVMTEVKRKFGDESGVQLIDSDLIGWINDAQRDIAQRERILKGKATVVSTAGVRDYTFPTVGILEVDSLHYRGRKVDNVSLAQAEQDYISNDAVNEQSQDPIIWYSWGGTFTFYPTPSTAENIDIYFSAIPANVVNSTDYLGVPDKWFNAVVHYVLTQAYEMDEDWQASQYKQQAYTEELTAQGDEERSAANMSYPTIVEVVPY